MMPCRHARELLDSFIAEELLVETNHELLRHLAGCPDCQTELDARVRLRAGLKQAFARSAALQMRPEFADQVVAKLRVPAAASARGDWQTRWLAIAASILVTAGVSVYFLGSRFPELARTAAGDHQNCAVKFALTERPISLQEAAARYDAAYARLETTPPDEVPTAVGTLRVADRHSCVFDNRRFGHVELRLDDHLVSLLMTKDESPEAPSSEADSQLSWLPRVNGLAMASFHTPGHIVYVVGDVDDTAFRQITRSLAEPVSRVAYLLPATADPGRLNHGSRHQRAFFGYEDTPGQLVKHRYALGEIGRENYDRRLTDLQK